MLTELQVKKLHKLFDVFDIIKDNHLDWRDFDYAAGKFLELHKVDESTLRAIELHQTYRHLWENCIQKPCEVSNDKKVNLSEWMNACNIMLSTKVGHENIDFLGEVIYESLDMDRNKKITIDEFVVLHHVYNIYDERLTNEIFNLLDVNHNGTLSKDEIIEAVNQFFYSDRKNEPGNFLFGKI